MVCLSNVYGTDNYRTDDGDAHQFTPADRSATERKFHSAVRHSRHVHMLRIGIPVAVAVAILAVVLAYWFNPLRALARLPLDIGNLVVSGTKITMKAPRLSGYTRDSRAYEVTARAAAQDLRQPHLMELSDLYAKIEMQTKSVVQMSATKGIYDTKSELLTLSPKIVLVSSTGYEGYLSEAVIDIRKGNIVSNKPVAVKLLNGTLNANRLEVVNAGQVVRFNGGVAMVLDLKKSSVSAKTEEQKP